jgi:hypothetical protein
MYFPGLTTTLGQKTSTKMQNLLFEISDNKEKLIFLFKMLCKFYALFHNTCSF